MAESLTIARPYAEAAFKLARDRNELPGWSDALSRLAVVAKADGAASLLDNPRLTEQQVAGLVGDAAGLLTAEQKNFVQMLATNDRLGVLPEIAALYEALKNEHEGVLDARVSSAYPLTDAQLADIVAILKAKYGKTVKASVVIDHSLIGGISIRIGDEVVDTSVRGKLAQLADALMN